ncbi:MAG: patatin-like phospholipase family protein, partial [Gemmatimonadota bacterium]|nr:patatin-like phospholipase family protein [Gemmatimonadota bacterium]
MRKNALVVSGGGSKGAFAVGAIDHIVNTLGIQFQFISGTSTGALIAPLVVTGNIDVLKDIYTSVRTRDILLRRELANILRSNSIFDVSPLDKLVRDTFDQARTAEILASNTQMALTTVCLQTGRVTYFQSGPTLNHAQDVDVHTIGDRETLRRAVIASADQPVLMPPVMIPSGADPPRQYVDGGVREYAPIRIAIDNGATDVYAIVLGPEDRPSKDN